MSSTTSTAAAQDADTGTAYVTVSISPDPGFELTFDGLTATEELGRPFLIVLDLSSGTVKGNTANLLGSSVTVTMTSATTTDKTYFNGILTRIGYAGLLGGVYRYHVELRPWIWLLSRVQDCRIFQNQSPWDIINAVFKANGFSALSDKRQNQAGSTPVLEYCVQYRESSLDFVTRLMEQYGIYYYFTHSNGEHTLVLADDPSSHSSIGKLPFYFAQTEQRAVDDHVWEWVADLHLQPGAYTYNDYNFTTPTADLTAKSLQTASTATTAGQYGSFEIYEYPGFYETASDGQTLAAVRMQDYTARVQLFDGKTNSRKLRAGTKFTLSNFSDAALNQEYLVTTATTSMTAAEGASDTRGNLVDSQRVVYTALASSVIYKLEQRTPRPMIRGPQTALVVGNAGDEITTDQYGRIKVQFYWDRIGTKDQNSSCWIRVAQTSAGIGWGSIIIPRVGMEAVVTFLEGNPDRPLITGVVYNATNTVPNTLPDKKVLSSMRSNSSKGGGGFNEFTMDDTKGNEAVFFQAQYNYNKKVLNNEVVEITQDTTTTVDKGNRAVTITQGNDTHTISQGNRSVTVTTGTDTLSVKGDRSVTVTTGNDSYTVSTGNRSVKVSTGNDDHTVSTGNRSATISVGNESVTVSVGNYTLECSAGNAKTTTGQAFEVSAGTSIKLSANVSIELSCGPTSLKLDPIAGVTISGPMVKVSADAEMQLSGGGMMALSAGLININ